MIIKIEGRDWELKFRGNGLTEDLDIDHIFDWNGHETFDATTAVEVDVGGELIPVEAGDTFIFVLVAD